MSVEHAIHVTYRVAPTGQAGLSHTQKLRVELDATTPDPAFDTALSTILLVTKGAGSPGTVDARSAISEYLAVFTAWASTAMSIIDVGLYRHPDGIGKDSQIVKLADLTDGLNYPNLTGQQAGSVDVAAEFTASFSTSSGKNGIVKFMECTPSTARVFVPSDLAGDVELLALVQYLAGPTSWIGMPNGAKIGDFRRATQGENEALYRRRFR